MDHPWKFSRQLKQSQKSYAGIPIIGGNIADAIGAKKMIEAGAEAVKVGMGLGSICTTRIIAGIEGKDSIHKVNWCPIRVN